MHIAIEGVIGVGKTSLTRLLQSAFSAEVLLEVFEENPFLSDFYSDRARYAFQTQIFFLLSRYGGVPTRDKWSALILRTSIALTTTSSAATASRPCSSSTPKRWTLCITRLTWS